MVLGKYDVVVVGGGHNGLVASIVLALHGARVALVESRGELGGLASDGVSLGVRYPRVAYSLGLFPRNLAKYIGVDLYLSAKLTNPSWVVVDGDSGETVFRWWVSEDALEEEFKEYGLGGEARDLVSLLRSWSECSDLILYSTEPPDIQGASAMLDNCSPFLGEIASQRFDNGLGMMVPRDLWGILTYPGLEREPGLATLLNLWNKGLWYQLPKGWSPLMKRLEHRARELGVDIYLGVGTARPDIKEGRVVGVTAVGGKLAIESKAVLYSASLAAISNFLGDYIDLLDGLRLKELESAARSAVKPQRVTVVGRCEPKPPGGFNRNPPMIEVWGRGFWGEFAYPTLHDESRIPGSGHAVAFTGMAASRISDILAYSGLECLDKVESIDSVVQWIEFNNPSAHPNHLPYTGERILNKRPVEGWSDYRVEEIEGLYHGSASSHPGGQVSGVPGHNAAIKVLKDLGVRPSSPLARTS
ncbi:MAG: FAD-dependent oxidoreductase [Aeropyrum sp.]|nr:FAD-dependent oxidoreductase [Aeropyrum sp.]